MSEGGMVKDSRGRARRAIDAAFRLALWSAYRLLKIYWFLFRPKIRGAGIFVVVDDSVLFLYHSYKPYWGVPAGVVGRDEELAPAAARELYEEVGLCVEPERLEWWGEVEDDFEYRVAKTTFFRWELDQAPPLRIDHREIIDGKFLRVADVDPRDLWPGVSSMLAKRCPVREQTGGSGS